MRNKKIILAIFSIVLIVLLTTISFAASFEEAVENYKNRNNTVVENDVKNTENTVKEENVKNEVENKVVVKEEPKKEELPEDTDATEKEDVRDEEVKEESEEIEEENVVTFKETILKDLYKMSDKKIEYKEVFIDSNAYIMSADELLLEDVKVDGNLFIMATNANLKNVLVDGSIYILGESINLDGQIDSIYACGNIITISSSTDIIKEARVTGDEVTFEGTAQRNIYIYGDTVKLTENANILGDCNIEATVTEISEDAKITGRKNIVITEKVEVAFDKMEIYKSIIAETVIILIVAIFVLNTSPKFIDVNGRLRLRDFFKAFFTGLLEIIFVIAILVALSYIGYGIGFGFALFILTFVFVYFGKMIFILSAGIRLSGKKEYVSRVKSFFMIIFVLLVVEAISLLQLTGMVGFLVSLITNLVLGITGFGSIVRVLLTPIRRNKPIKVKQPKKTEMKVEVYDSYVEDALKEKEMTKIEEPKVQEVKEEKTEIKEEPIVEEVKEEPKTEGKVEEPEVKEETEKNEEEK